MNKNLFFKNQKNRIARIVLISLAILLLANQSTFATSLSEVLETAGMPTYGIGSYNDGRVNSAVCQLTYPQECDVSQDVSQENYGRIIEELYQPLAINIFSETKPGDWLKASSKYGIGNIMKLYCWGYGGLQEPTIYSTYPEIRAYKLNGTPDDRVNPEPDYRILSYFQTKLTSDFGTKEKSIIGLSSCPKSDEPVYDGILESENVTGYNFITLEKFVNSKFFSGVNASGDITVPLSPAGVGNDPVIKQFRWDPGASGYSLTINVVDANNNPVNNAFVMPLLTNITWWNYRMTPSTGTITYNNANGTIPLYVIADLGSRNFYSGETTLVVDSNRTVTITLDRPYGKSKLWGQFVARTSTYNIRDLALETFIFFPQFHKSYLPLENAKLEKAIGDWSSGYLGKPIISRHAFNGQLVKEADFQLPNYSLIGNGLDDIFKFRETSIGWENLFNPGDSAGGIVVAPGFEGVGQEPYVYDYYLRGLPFLATHQFTELDYISSFLLDRTRESLINISKKFGEIMNRMRYLGGWYGEELNLAKVLWFAGGGLNSLHSLVPVANITWSGWGPSADLSGFNLNDYNIILLGYDLNQAGLEKVENFVRNGGGVLLTYIRWPLASNLENLTGVRFSGSKTPGSLEITDPTNPVLRPYGTAVLQEFPYEGRSLVKTIISPSVKVIVNDTNSGPVIWENNLGSGKVIVLNQNYGQFGAEGSWNSYNSTFAVTSLHILFRNAILHLINRGDLNPSIWYTQFKDKQSWWPNKIYYTLTGKPNGPKLFWISNLETNVVPFEVHLSANFLNISPAGWIVIDANSMRVVAKGSGDDIRISLDLPAQSWSPLYINSLPVDNSEIYTNVFLTGKQVSGERSSFTIDGPYRLNKWTLVYSQNRPTSISTNSTGLLREFSSLTELFNNNGWYHDAVNQVLYIKFKESRALTNLRAFYGNDEISTNVRIAELDRTFITPYTLNLDFGTYNLEAEYLGNKISRTIVVNSEAPVTVDFNFPALSYYGNMFAINNLSGVALDGQNVKASIRFTAQQSKQLSKIYFYTVWTPNPPTYRIGVQSDDGNGRPNGTWIDSGVVSGLTGNAWQNISLNVPLVAGQTYHIVFQWESGPVYREASTSIQNVAPINYVLPKNQIRDSKQNILVSIDSGVTWNARNAQPVYILEFSDGTLEGQPYINNWLYSRITGSRFEGELIQIERDLRIAGVSFFVGKAGSPQDNLYLNIYDVSAGRLLLQEQIARPADVTSGWIPLYRLQNLLTLTANRQYRVYLSSPNSTTDGYTLSPLNNSTPTFNSETFDGIRSYRIYSTNSGASWASDLGGDVSFYFISE